MSPRAEDKPISSSADEQCVYPPDTGRSSRSKSPTTPAPHSNAHLGAESTSTRLPTNANREVPDQDFVSTINPAYFSHSALSLPEEPFNLQSTTNNTLAVWSPNIPTPSPSTLFNSLFGTQTQTQVQGMDTFSYAPPSNSQYTNFSLNDPYSTLPQSAQLGEIAMNPSNTINTSQYAHPTSVRYKDTFNWNALSPKSLAARDGTGRLEMDPLSLDPASSESTPISLNSSNAFNSTFAFVQQEYRDRPEHPAYLYQLQLLEQPDLLTPFFPSLEQRHQVRPNHTSRRT